ncbi:hypothetical protein OQA88_3244 [Cercophora sp. LCS_1]
MAGCLAPLAFADYLGPHYAPPRDLSSNNSVVKTAWDDVTHTLNLLLRPKDTTNHTNGPLKLPVPINATDAQNVTFSLGLFSLRDPAATTLQFHYTSPGIATAPNGTQKVNGDSIYRIASVTKAFTVLAGLLELDSDDWDRPLNQILPSLGLNNDMDSSVLSTPWDQITMRALAAQIGGVPRDGFPSLGELALTAMLDNTTSTSALLAASGLPPPDSSDPLQAPPCLALLLAGETCTPTEYALGVAPRPPAFHPWTTPGYSNNGFALLGLAIANATNKSISTIYSSRIFQPLRLDSTTSEAPPPAEWSNAVIVGDPALSGFVVPNGVFVSTGGLFSSLGDLSRFGIGILNSTLLPRAETRRWLKPASHTAKLTHSVGAPWEIARYVDETTGVVTDLYTKNGDSGYYTAYFVLIPDYDVGFALLSASESTERIVVASAVADLVVESLLPALKGQAEKEAERAYGGRYVAQGVNSSITLGVALDHAPAAPGIVIKEWVSNGTDVLTWLPRVFGKGPFRLVPSVTDKETGTKGQVAFRLVSGADAPVPLSVEESGRGLLSAIPDWVIADVSTYFGIGLSLFVFDLDGAGKATAVSPAAWRVKLNREE